MANKIHHSYFVEGTLDEVNAGLSAYHLAEQTTGIHKMTFELIDTNNNIHYLTQTFSVFNEGERPVTPDSTVGISIHQQRLYRLLIIPVQIATLKQPIIYKLRLLMSWLSTTRALTQQLAETKLLRF